MSSVISLKIDRHRKWIIVGLLTLLFHLLIFLLHLPNLSPKERPRVDIVTVDPAKLAQIRKQWKKIAPKSLLLSKDQPKSDIAPENARYFSDRNIRVQKEQRARNTDVLPKPGSQTKSQSQPQSQSQSQAESLPKLSDLGISLQQKPKLFSQTQSQSSQPFSQPSVDQSLLDQSLSEGSENLLNAQESVYYSFYSRIYNAIAPIWSSRIREVAQNAKLQAGDYTTLTNITLDANGNLVDIQIIKSSGIEVFDQAVLYSWRRVNRFPNPPKGLLHPESPEGLVQLGWSFTVQMGQSFPFQALPPSRVY